MGTNWLPYVSYSLWALFDSPVGRETSHCHTIRGFKKARNKEPQVKVLIERDTMPQQVGHLAQMIVFEYHQCPAHVVSDGAQYEWIAQKISLHDLPEDIQPRIETILKNYIQTPFLKAKDIIALSRGDEGFPKPIKLSHNHFYFNLYASFDCVVRESNGSINIIDFKTGKSRFDRRQAFVYLLAARTQLDEKDISASFYNLETQEYSGLIQATDTQLKAVEIELMRIAKKHQIEVRAFRENPQDFYSIYPPNINWQCERCHFRSVCDSQ